MSETTRQKKKKHHLLRLIVILLVILLLFLIGSVFYFTRGKAALKQADYKGITIERYPLPRRNTSKERETLPASDFLQQTQTIDTLMKAIKADSSLSFDVRRIKVDSLEQLLGELKDRAVFTVQTICGDHDNSEDVQQYTVRMGIPKDFVLRMAKPVGLLRWNNDFGDAFHGAGDNEGNVKGLRWASGCLIGDNYFITAGHCLKPMVNGYTTPIRGRLALESKELAKYMNVVFNYETDNATGKLRRDTMSFPVEDLVEFEHGDCDYAVLKLGKNKGQDAGVKFGHLSIDPYPIADQASLCVIQHPNGSEKRVDVGPLKFSDRTFLYYDHIDTEAGASGSPVISYPNGYIEGIHIIGGCTPTKGSNQAVKIQSIMLYSQVLHP